MYLCMVVRLAHRQIVVVSKGHALFARLYIAVGPIDDRGHGRPGSPRNGRPFDFRRYSRIKSRAPTTLSMSPTHFSSTPAYAASIWFRTHRTRFLITEAPFPE